MRPLDRLISHVRRRIQRPLSAVGLVVAASAPLSAQTLRYGIGNWPADSLGNHRAVVRVATPNAAVFVHIPWRRRDADPERKEVLIYSARTAQRVTNLSRVEINRDYGDFVFEPVSGPGDYYFYYLPYSGTVTSNYPRIAYRRPEPKADLGWLSRYSPSTADAAERAKASLARASVVEIQSVDAFSAFSPMEIVATADEMKLLLDRNRARYLVFPEDRRDPIRMTTLLPQRWAERGPGGTLAGTADRGEFYAFQLGVFASRAPVHDVKVAFSALRNTAGAAIPASAFRCINLGGVDWQGRDFTRTVDIDSGVVQPIWCGVEVPIDAAPGEYEATAAVTAAGDRPTAIGLRLTITENVIRHAGDDDPSRLSRLRWLDSRLAMDDGIVPPYTPVTVHGDTLGVLGRRITLGRDGLPSSLESFFAIEMTGLTTTPRALLAAPIALVVEDANGNALPWSPGGAKVLRQAEGAVWWEAWNTSGPLSMHVNAELEFDGTIDFTVALTARDSVRLNDVRLEIPFARDVARYAMGLGLKGGTRPATFDWKWDVQHNQDGAWIGDVNAGLQFSLRDDRYSRPLNTNFYLSKPLVMPASWQNGGKGGCQLRDRASGTYTVTCYSGARTMERGETQWFNFRLLVTPFHPIDALAQWRTRFFHRFAPVDSIASLGANVVNVHHDTDINPWLNYPFLRPDAMKAYVNQAHRRGMKVKIYYTVRELTDHAPELFALRSLGDEVIAPGPGGGFSWLQEHLDGNYIPGWHVPRIKDATVINTGISRWHNFYVEGLRWLVENVGIDGLYLDDVAFDRTTMKRVRKVLARGRPGALIDLHSANQFNPRDGFANSANLYLEHFPYIDRLWFGEYFDYNSPSDFWLTELSGIPFGLMGEMLQDGGNPWRGMVFGMTNRAPWSGDPTPLWRYWDAFRMQDTRMIGFWVPANPVKTGRDDVLATVYQAKDRALVSIASWAPAPVSVALRIDWESLGIDKSKAVIRAVPIEKFQEAATFALGQAIPVAPGKGWLLEIRKR
jgi:hypothetical protein